MTLMRKTYKEACCMLIMKKSPEYVERNVSASFGYVKKDILMLNDSFSELNDKFQQLLGQYQTLVDEVKKMKDILPKKKVTKKASAKKKVSKK